MSDSSTLHNIIIIVQLIEISMNLCVLFFLLIRKNELQQRLLIFMAYAVAVYNLALMGEIMPFATFSLIYFCKCIETVAVGMFQIPFLMFCFQYANKTIRPYVLRILMAVYGAICFVQFIDIDKGLYYKSIRYVEDGAFNRIEVELGVFGTLFWLVMVFGTHIVEIIVLIQGALKEKDKTNKKRRIKFIIQTCSAGVVFFISLPLIYATGYDPLMLYVGFALCTKIFLTWKKQGLDIISVAAKAALDSLGQPVIILDSFGIFLYYNKRAKEVISVIDQYVGKDISEFQDYAKMSGYMLDDNEFTKDGMFFHSKWDDVIDSDGERVGRAITFIDVTSERLALEDIKRKKEKADEANEAKSAFLANMSHEIRTPMNAIIGMSELIIEESRGRKVYNMALQIRKAAKNLLSIINNILDYSKMEAGKMELVEDEYQLEEMVNDTFNLISIPALERGLSVNLYLDESLPYLCYGDSGKISQVLINLLNNAVKFTKKGHIDLTVNGSVSGDNVKLIFSVEDTGTGITKEDQALIFESYAQVDKINNKSIEGTGLGLSITQGLVQMLGGKIALSSVYGEGSTFSVFVTQKVVDGQSIKDHKTVAMPKNEERRLFTSPDTKVLVCDDNNINLLVVEGMLEIYELDVKYCSSGKEAIDCVLDEDYDIIMMDHMMPEMDGIEATGHIRTVVSSRTKKPYIIALTANSYEGAKEMFLERGFDDFLPKPIDKIALYEKLLEIIPKWKIKFESDDVAPLSYTEDSLASIFMDGIDVRRAMDMRGGTINDYLKILELYYLEGLDRISDIKKAYDNKDYIKYEILVHGLKSTSLSIGADHLSDIAKAHEYAVKDNNIQFIDNNINKLCDEYDKILQEIKTVLISKGIMDKEDDNNRLDGMTNKLLKEKLIKALAFSEDFKSKEASLELDEILRYKLDDDINKAINDIKTHFKMYDDDAAEDAIRELLGDIDADD